MEGSGGSIFAIGDCTASAYAPTAQVASQQGAYLARMLTLMARRDTLEARLSALEQEVDAASGEEDQKRLESESDGLRKRLGKVTLRPFHYSHQGSLAYVLSLTFCGGGLLIFGDKVHWFRQGYR